MPDLIMYTNYQLNFHPHYVATFGMYLHLVGYQTEQGISNVDRGKQDTCHSISIIRNIYVGI